MFDKNDFKKSVKSWIEKNGESSSKQLETYCLSLIPSSDLRKNRWLIDQTLSWFQYIQDQRSATRASRQLEMMQ